MTQTNDTGVFADLEAAKARVFFDAVARLGFPLPWTPDPYTDEILAADGTVVCQVDPDGVAPGGQTPDGMYQLMVLIAGAADSAGGYGAEE